MKKASDQLEISKENGTKKNTSIYNKNRPNIGDVVPHKDAENIMKETCDQERILKENAIKKGHLYLERKSSTEISVSRSEERGYGNINTQSGS